MAARKFDVVGLGEILIDFTSIGKNEDGKNIYEENSGGAVPNCIATVAKLGGKSAFIGMTGRDSFGEDIRNALKSINVDISGMRYTDKQHTTLAFVSLDANGERSFSFCRNPGADTQITPSDLDSELLATTKFFQLGSLSLTHEPAKSATLAAIDIAKKSGSYISYDPNWRANLWSGHDDAIDQMKWLLQFADMVKVSDEEAELLFGKGISNEAAAKKIHDYGAKLVLITLGAKGVFYSANVASGKFSGTLGVPKVQVVDTTGAGDSFTGGTLYRITRRENPFVFTKETIEADLRFANAVAALCVTKRGGIPALPTFDEVQKFLLEQK